MLFFYGFCFFQQQKTRQTAIWPKDQLAIILKLRNVVKGKDHLQSVKKIMRSEVDQLFC